MCLGSARDSPTGMPVRNGSARWTFRGTIPYERGRELQKLAACEREKGSAPDRLLLLEHPPVVTLGKRADTGDFMVAPDRLVKMGIEVVQTDRGGRATYHGPGQLVGYAIVRLGHGGREVRSFVERIVRMMCSASRSLGAYAAAPGPHPGVWVGGNKVASVGISVQRGITRHGFALNVDMDLAPFSSIIPCGIPGAAITDLRTVTGRLVTIDDAVRAVVSAWKDHIGEIEEQPTWNPESGEENDGRRRLRQAHARW